MQKVKIVTDSSATMTKEKINELKINVIPLTVMIDSVIYIDGVTVQSEDFMTLMAESQALPKTSQPPIGEFVELYNELSRDGSKIISIHLSESLSGTVNTARQAAQLSEGDITVIDSHFTDQSLAFMVQKAAQMALDGADKDEIVNEVIDMRDHHSYLYMGVAHLDNLVKGGRISKLQGALSSLLNMRIMLQMKDSEIDVFAKGRGEKMFLKWFKSFLEQVKNENIVRLGISYAGDITLAQKFADQLQPLLPDVNIQLLQTSPIIATHSGEGAFAIMYVTK